MTALLVEQSLGLAQLQDGGRFGVRHLGVTQGGALDWWAMRWANWLLDNPPTACVLEIPLGGLQLRCQGSTRLAVCGADLDARLDDEPLPLWQNVQVGDGQRLSFHAARHGVRAYLAVPGGFQAPAVMGSCSTVSREGLGGLDGLGGALHSGARLPFAGGDRPARSVPSHQRTLTLPPAQGSVTLELLLGAEYRQFSGRSLFAAFNNPWQVDARSDRMGVRLTGTALAYRGPGLISEGIPLGAVQVPPDGQPIVLLNDRQTIGGYPRLGALLPIACARLAQCGPGTTVHLRPARVRSARRDVLNLLEQTTW